MMACAEVDPDLLLPNDYKVLPLKALRPTSRQKIGQYLNLDGTVVVCLDDEGNEIDVSTNYNGLAELAGFDYLDIRNLERHKNPTLELLDCWTSKESRNATVGYLWKYLHKMEREDVLRDCRRAILNDCKVYKEYTQIQLDAERINYDPVQDPTVDSSGVDDMKVDETDVATKQDIESQLEGDNTRITYDAFVCYSIEDYSDRQFVRDMIEEIEFKRGQKLFVPGRDDIPGAAQNTINAYLIEKRCRRVVILLSKAFLESPVCDFQLKFAQCLAPGARSKRLIPVLREKCITTPRILRFLAVCDFTKSDMVDWVWDRLGAAIKAPIGPMISDASVELEESLKEVTFPAQKRRLQNDTETPPSHRRSGNGERQPKPPSQSRAPARRYNSFGGHSSRDPVESKRFSSTPPSVFPSGAMANQTQPIPINNKSQPQYPRAIFSPQEGQMKMELAPEEEHWMEMSMEESREHFV